MQAHIKSRRPGCHDVSLCRADAGHALVPCTLPQLHPSSRSTSSFHCVDPHGKYQRGCAAALVTTAGSDSMLSLLSMQDQAATGSVKHRPARHCRRVNPKP